MKGYYITGTNKAHKSDNRRSSFFKCPMYGTFNVKVDTKVNFESFIPSLAQMNTEYYLVKIKKNNKFYYAYLLNWKKSNQAENVLEIVSKRPLPDTLKEGEIEIEIMEKWTNQKRDEWAKEIYWWETFDWSPKKRADSKDLFNKINEKINWSGKSVLDIGSNYGYHSFNASKRGAYVTGVEINDSARKKAEIINDHIEMQDVKFYKRDTNKDYNVIMILSVIHQFNPSYDKLQEILDSYKKRCQTLFVELILQPNFGGKFTNEEIDKIVDGTILYTYKHNVRGIRRLYEWNRNEKKI